jgi:hypothetical protein
MRSDDIHGRSNVRVHLLEQQDFTQRDLIPDFRSETAVSMFLAKQRKLTLQRVGKLSARFKLAAETFLSKADSRDRVLAELTGSPGTLIFRISALT